MGKQKIEITSLYYITHIENVKSILTYGLLSHNNIINRKINFKPIYDEEIINRRKDKVTPNSRSLWDFANVYFQPRNPMLYRLIKQMDNPNDIVVLGLSPEVLKLPGIYITDGNAANDPTDFFISKDGLKEISKIWSIINSEWWNSNDGSKRKIMAECLVPNSINSDLIHSMFVYNHDVAEKVKTLIAPSNIPIIPEPNIFFYPAKRSRITENLSLAEGDMFFSNMQTLTVSVNTVGIMGKGLASRAKYQFPDVYVQYQDACRNKLLKMGQPFLYKRESPFDEELIDEPTVIDKTNGSSTLNGEKWFLLFATKRHWKEDSDLKGIEEGLNWLVSNYRKEGIKSIALPALGCGLGNLDWKDIGPTMVRHLAKMDIRAVIYLPREKPIDEDLLKPEFLL